MSAFRFRLACVSLLALSVGISPSTPLHAEAPSGVIVVDGTCTLRDAIRSANSDTDIGSCSGAGGAEEIVLDADVRLVAPDPTYSTNPAGSYAGLPNVTSVMTIRAGNGSVIERDPALSCQNNFLDRFRLFNVLGGELTLEGLTLRFGCASRGGAIFLGNSGRLEVKDSHFDSNVARVYGGAIVASASLGSSLAVSRSSFVRNRAGLSGGAIDTSVTTHISESDFFQDFAEPQSADGSEAASRGGAVYASGSGAILDIVDSTFQANSARGFSGGKAGGRSASGGAIMVDSGAQATLENLVIVGNTAKGGSSLTGRGGDGVGGGVVMAGGGAENLLILQNRAIGGVGRRGGDAHAGGLSTAGLGTVELSQISLVGNSARGGEGPTNRGGSAFGGGLDASFLHSASNLTVSGNIVWGGGSEPGVGGNALGGGVFARNGFDAAFSHATISGNRVVRGSGGTSDGVARGGGVYIEAMETLRFDNSVIADDGMTDGEDGLLPHDCHVFASGALSDGFNLVETPGVCEFLEPTDRIGIETSLLPLTADGCIQSLPGDICLPVHPLSSGSPAIDGGSCLVSGVAIDARGVSRPFDHPDRLNLADGCDVGAYQWTAPAEL